MNLMTGGRADNPATDKNGTNPTVDTLLADGPPSAAAMVDFALYEANPVTGSLDNTPDHLRAQLAAFAKMAQRADPLTVATARAVVAERLGRDHGIPPGTVRRLLEEADSYLPPYRKGGEGNKERPFDHDVADPSVQLPEVTWKVHGWVAAGALTVMSGRPKVGKSTLLYQMVAEAANGQPYLGTFTTGTPLRSYWLNLDQPAGVTTNRIRACDADVQGVRVADQRGRFSRSQLETLADRVADHGADILVVDSLSKWFGAVGFEDENDAGQWNRVLDLFGPILDTGVAVVGLHHDKKGGLGRSRANDWDELRGSNGVAGTADVLFRVLDDAPEYPKRRIVAGGGRYADTTPEQLLIEYETPLYRSLGVPSAVRLQEATEPVLDALASRQGEWVKLGDLMADTGISRARLQRLVEGMVGEKVERTVLAERGAPIAYRVCSGIISYPRSPIGKEKRITPAREAA